MHSLSRFLAASLALLLGLVVAAAGAQLWLRQQEKRLNEAAEADFRQRLRAAAALTGRLDGEWTPSRLALVQEVVGSPLRLAAGDSGVEVEPGVRLERVGNARPAQPWHALYQRVLLALVLLAGVLLIALASLTLVRRARDSTAAPEDPRANQRDTLSLARLAQTSAEQKVELDRERDERLRAEAEARVRLQMLNRSLEEQIRIGRDLHDGVIQSLYAAGLTLQSAQSILKDNPEEASRRADLTVDMINRTIAEVRAYISGLSPLAVRAVPMTQALAQVVNELRAGSAVQCDTQVDESAAVALNDAQMSDALQIAREAVSNALRHGRPGHIMVRLQACDDGVHLHVQDDGAGFAPASLPAARGHGLNNLRARAQESGGRLVLDSAPGQGTRVWVFWPDARHS